MENLTNISEPQVPPNDQKTNIEFIDIFVCLPELRFRNIRQVTPYRTREISEMVWWCANSTSISSLCLCYTLRGVLVTL